MSSKHSTFWAWGTLALGLSQAALGASTFPWGTGTAPEEEKALRETVVCTDGASHFVVVAPHPVRDEHPLRKWVMFYGDPKQLVPVLPADYRVGNLFFMDPRFFRPMESPFWQGQDLRIHSEVTLPNKEEAACTVRCGGRTVRLKTLEPEEARRLLLAVHWVDNPQEFIPYALLRDETGRYYFVDRGIRPGQEKNFRLFVGPKGKLVLAKMVNVVSDSEGDIFSTQRGDLRLILDRVKPSYWVEHKRRTELRALPVEANLPLVYSELGVYRGARLGTPCDDL